MNSEPDTIILFFHLVKDAEEIGYRLEIDHGQFKLGLNHQLSQLTGEYFFESLSEVQTFIKAWS